MLLDSNIIIYASQRAHADLRTWLRAQRIEVSAVSRIEALGRPDLSPQEEAIIVAIFATAELFPISETVVDRATKLRRRRRMKLGDSLIAATALVHNLPLATHNTDDFDNIPDLQVHDPLSP